MLQRGLMPPGKLSAGAYSRFAYPGSGSVDSGGGRGSRLLGGSFSRAMAINEAGQVVGGVIGPISTRAPSARSCGPQPAA